MFSSCIDLDNALRIRQLYFLPDFTEHPKPQRRKTVQSAPSPSQDPPNDNHTNDDDDSEDEVTFFQDFVAGGMAGSASVVVGHPFDTLKVRVQSAVGGSSNKGMMAMLAEFGGIASLYRGMGAPLSAAAAINAVVFSSYGTASRFYDQYFVASDVEDEDDGPVLNHDPWQKSMVCGSFAGFTQCFIICPMEQYVENMQAMEQSPWNTW